MQENRLLKDQGVKVLKKLHGVPTRISFQGREYALLPGKGGIKVNDPGRGGNPSDPPRGG